MKIAIFADVHDNAHNLVLAFDAIKDKKIEKILFLGDFVGAAIGKLLVSSPIPVFAIWGNNDGDRSMITKFSFEEGSNLEVGFDTYDIVDYAGRKLFLTHYPLIAKPIAKSGEFDAVFYGHNHLKAKEKVKDCLVVNPGEIGAYKTGIASYAIYDTKTNDANIYVLENSVTTNTKEAKKRFEEIKLEWNSLKSHRME